MRKKASSKMPPASWIQQAQETLVGAFGFETDHLLERDHVLIEWYERGVLPRELPTVIEPIDKTVAQWLSRFSRLTYRTYQTALRRLAADGVLPAVHDARTLLQRALSNPDAVETLLTRYATTSTRKTGSVRNALTAFHRATYALYEAGMIKRPIDVVRPRDTDVDLAAPTPELLVNLDRELAKSAEPRTKRARAEMLLAAEGLRAREICALNVEDFHGTRVVVGGDRVRIGKRTTDAIRLWLEHRGRSLGPMFVSYDGNSGRLTNERMSTRSLERDMVRVTRGAVSLRSLRRFAVVNAVERFGASAGRRVARLTKHHGVTRMVHGARAAADVDT
jgi:integrase